MKARIDTKRIATGLRAERRGKVRSAGGYFGALQLLGDIQARFQVPTGGGRPTDPQWTERRLVPLAPRTLERLEALSALVREQEGVGIEPMQLAALLLEKSTEQFSHVEAKALVQPRRRGPKSRTR